MDERQMNMASEQNLYYGHDAAEILLKRNPRRVLEVTDPGGVWR